MVIPKRSIRSSASIQLREREPPNPPTGVALFSCFGRRGEGDEGVTTTYIGNYYEWTDAGSAQYYYSGSQPIAMRRSGYGGDNGLFWVFGDHLGSTSVTANSGGGYFSEVRYKAWGETRFTSGNTPTTFRYTGQREQPELGLYFYNARWYDPALGRFIQADTIVPEPGNSQAWDRFAYTLNNPLRYVDPSGHDADCGMWESACKNMVKAYDQYIARMMQEYSDYLTDVSRQDYLISKIFPGLVSDNSSWTYADWEQYYNEREELWRTPPGGESFPELVERLTPYYSNQEKFVRDFALLFGGVPWGSSWSRAAWESRGGPPLPILNVTNQGLQGDYSDNRSGENQSHHYAGFFFLGYYIGPDYPDLIGIVRDIGNAGDIRLGEAAADDGWNYHLGLSIPTIVDYINLHWVR